MKSVILSFFAASGILAALLGGCFNPITVVPPQSGDSLTEAGIQEEANGKGAGIPDTGSFVVTIPVNPEPGGASGRAAAGLNEAGKIKNGGIINSFLLVVLNDERDVVDSREGIKTGDTDKFAQVDLLLSPGKYDFLLLMGHRERNYAQEGSGGPYLYKAGSPTLLAAGFMGNEDIDKERKEVDITMYPLAVEAVFTSETAGVSPVEAAAAGVDLEEAEDWKVNENGLDQLKAAWRPEEPDYLFREVSGKAWETGGGFTGFSRNARFDYGTGEITLNLGEAPKGVPCAAWFNLEYAPFSLGEWDGPVWVIRNGVNDLPQDDKTDFRVDNNKKIQWSSEKNGNGAVRFTLPAPGRFRPFSGGTGKDDSVIDLIRAVAGQTSLSLSLASMPVEMARFDAATDLGAGWLALDRTNSPAELIIDGGGRVIDLTGSAKDVPLITVGSGVTLTLRNIAFKGLSTADGDGMDNSAPVIKVDGGGTLILKDGALITGNNYSEGNGGGVYVVGGDFTMNGGIVSYKARRSESIRMAQTALRATPASVSV